MNNKVAQALRHASWRKSSYSQGENTCVEIATAVGGVGIRDSKLADASPILTVSIDGWRDLITAIRDGELGG
ncbi:MAG: DUF397 domain-containing protein [Pseudonocardia sp.]